MGDEILILHVPEPECNFDKPPRIENKKFTLLKFQDMNFGVKHLHFLSVVLEPLVEYDTMIVSG